MKLATYRDGSRDGQLLVVSRDLSTGHYAAGIAGRLQQVLDDWNFLSPQLEDLYTTLNQGKARHAFAFDPARCLAPLPRAFHWAVAAGGDDVPLLLHASGDRLWGAHEAPHADADADARSNAAAAPARLVAVTGDVAMGVSPAQALEGIRLLMLARGSGGRCAFAPVAVTPDELGAGWQAGRTTLAPARPGERAPAAAPAGAPWRFHLGELIAHLAQAQPLGAGSLVGSEPLLDVSGDTPGAAADAALELKTADGHSVFGAIVPARAAAA